MPRSANPVVNVLCPLSSSADATSISHTWPFISQSAPSWQLTFPAQERSVGASTSWGLPLDHFPTATVRSVSARYSSRFPLNLVPVFRVPPLDLRSRLAHPVASLPKLFSGCVLPPELQRPSEGHSTLIGGKPEMPANDSCQAHPTHRRAVAREFSAELKSEKVSLSVQEVEGAWNLSLVPMCQSSSSSHDS